MSTEKIYFNKSIEYGNREKFGFRFEGLVSNQNIDKAKINKLIDDFANEQKFHKDMLRNVSFLRTC
ncbi:MAG: hypothetical protein PUB18_04455 [bacterium]|nr:hypothetical protein [bacterium]